MDAQTAAANSANSGGNTPGLSAGHHHKNSAGGPPQSPASGTALGANPGRIVGYTLRNNFEAGYAITGNMKISPILTVDDKFYGNGNLELGDPSIRWTLEHVASKRYREGTFDSDVWLSYSAPVSNMSKLDHSYGSATFAFIPRFTITDSRFFITTVSSASVGAAGEEAIYAPVRFSESATTDYRFSRRWTVFAGPNFSKSLGNNAPMDVNRVTDPNQLAYARFMNNNGNTNIMTTVSAGVFFRPMGTVTVSPRVTWMSSQSLENGTTASLSAGMSLL